MAVSQAVVEKMTTRLKAYQATAVPPVKPEGCQPVIDKQDAWRPCDSPEVLEDGYNVERTDQFHRARSTQSPYALAGTDSEGTRERKTLALALALALAMPCTLAFAIPYASDPDENRSFAKAGLGQTHTDTLKASGVVCACRESLR
jgi:hypothetical protein